MSSRRDALILVAATIASRVAVLLLLPERAYSVDLGNWSTVADLLHRGTNPYAATPYLNWPPLWMQLLYAFGAVARMLGVETVNVIRAFLIVIDSINIVLVLAIAQRFFTIARPVRLLMLGLVLNPVSLFLTCQHANFDALVVTALLCFTLALLRWRETTDAVDWLSAAFALGIGVLAKTMPLVLAPLLAWRASLLSGRAKLLGALLVVIPAAIGVSVIYVLAPGPVAAYVLRYRSSTGWWGITGILELLGLGAVSELYSTLFPVLLLVSLVVIGRAIRRTTELTAHQFVLLTAILLLGLIAFGNGYGAQYLAWPLPFLVLTFGLGDQTWRRDLLAAWIVTSITYIAEYALVYGHGAFLVGIAPYSTVRRVADVLGDDGPLTLLRLPMFAAFVWLVVNGARRLRSSMERVPD